MEGELSNPTRLGREDAPGRLEGRWEKAALDSIPSTVTAPLAKRRENKIHPRNQPGGTRSGGPRRGPRRARERGGRRAPSTPGGDQPGRPASRAAPGACTPARRRPAAAAYRGAWQLPPRRPSTAAAVRAPPRGGARLARPQLPAPPQRRRSREKPAESAQRAGEEEGRGCQRRRPLLRRIRRAGRHCASSPTSLLVAREPSTARKEAAVWLRRARHSLRSARWKRVKSGGGGGGGGGERWSAGLLPHPRDPGGREGSWCVSLGDPRRPVEPGGRRAGSAHPGFRSVSQPLGVVGGRPLRGPAS